MAKAEEVKDTKTTAAGGAPANPAPNGGGNGGAKRDVFAETFAKESEFEKFAISRPMFLVQQCKGAVQGLFLYIAGPFAPGKKAINNDPWYAYVVKLTAPCEVVDPSGAVVKAAFGDEIMLPIAAQLRNIANVVQDEKYVTELQITPGPQPRPREMRVWEGKNGRRLPRGNDFPRLEFGKGIPLALPQGDAVEEVDGGTPF